VTVAAQSALRSCADWPVEHVAAAWLCGAVRKDSIGDTARPFRLASIAKVITAWACLVAVEEGVVGLDDAVGQPGCTLRHLLSHAGGYPFDGPQPIAAPGKRRIYSNTGIELAADAVATAAAMPFESYLDEAVLRPLAMSATVLRGSPAHAMWSTVDDLCRFLGELTEPRLIDPSTAAAARSVQFGGLRGVVPGVGAFADCVWGLGCELRGDKSPHWTGTLNSPATFGHFGGAGTLMWVDPAVGAALIALTDRPFDEWAAEALAAWPALSDDVVRAQRGLQA
jgi:CubicO group peptidase (beta-lactamase class C family)